MKNFKLSGLKVDAYSRWSLTGGTNYSELTAEKFGILEKWSLT